MTAATAAAFRSQGWVWCARYLRRDVHVNDVPDTGGGVVTLSKQELANLLAAGLAVVPVQLGDAKLVPTAAAGNSVGTAAAQNARTLGFPVGVTIWCDLEWAANPPTDTQAVIDYVNAWAAPVVAGGYGAGLYVGPNVPLSGAQLYALPKFSHYWKAASVTPWVETRGFQIVQSLTLNANGIAIDADVVCIDGKGGRPTWYVGG
ncbi:glycoside hydrolase domain-containing protein [Nannocystaceae bacterium ST9]